MCCMPLLQINKFFISSSISIDVIGDEVFQLCWSIV